MATYHSTADKKSDFENEQVRAELGMRVLDLPAFTTGIKLARAVWEWTATIPQQFEGVVDQVTRSACSVPANVAEGVGRATPGQQLQFARYAFGSALETFSHLTVSPVPVPPELIETTKETCREVQAWCLHLAKERVG